MESFDCPVMAGKRIWLRSFERTDLPAYQKAVNNYDTSYWALFIAGGPLGVEDVEEWYEKRVRAEHRKSSFYFVISSLHKDDFLGSVWLWNRDSRFGGAEFSIFLAEDAGRSRGVGTEATNLLVDFAFGFRHFERIWLTTLEENVRAQRSFEKAGFVREGLVRGHYVMKGNLVNSVQMSMLRSDWEHLDRPRFWDQNRNT